jgi:hypothetical protein
LAERRAFDRGDLVFEAAGILASAEGVVVEVADAAVGSAAVEGVKIFVYAIGELEASFVSVA